MYTRSVSLLFLMLWSLSIWGQAQANFAQAQQLSESSQYLASNLHLQELIRLHPERKYDIARALFLKSFNLLQLGDYAGAWDANEHSLQLREELRMDDTAENYMRRGLIWREKGDYHRALAALFQARDLPIADASLYALISAYTASVYSALGDFAKAKTEYEYAEESLLIAYGDESLDLATLYYDIGILFLRQTKTADAESYLEKARSMLEKIRRRPDMLARTLNALGQTKATASEPQAAIPYYEQALRVLQNGMVSDYPEMARIRINLSRGLMAAEETSEASSQLDSAIHLLGSSLAFGQLPTAATLSFQPKLLAEALSLKSKLMLEADDLLEVKQAYPIARTGVLILARYLSSLREEGSRLIAQEAVKEVFGQAIEAAMRIAQVYGEPTYEAEALGIAEMSKGYSLRDLVKEKSYQDPNLQQLQIELNSLRIRFALQPEDQVLEQALRDQVVQWEATIRSQVYPTAMQASIYEQAIPDLARIRQGLADKQALVSFYIGEEYYYIFLLRDDRLTTHRLRLSRFGLRQKKNTALVAIRNVPDVSGGVYTRVDRNTEQVNLESSVGRFMRSIRKSDIETFVFEGGMIYGNLLAPLESNLGGINHLLISPHTYLHDLSFAALLPTYVEKEKDEKLKWSKLTYLIEHFDLSYTYSALYTSTPWKTEEQSLLAVAPIFNDEAEIIAENRFLFDTSLYRYPSLRNTSPDGRSLAALPFSKDEVQSIAELFIDEELATTVLLRAEATETALRQQFGNARYIHLATHGFVNFTDPSLSGIALTQPAESGEDATDGMLFAGEIYDLDLEGQTIVMSACDSGLGDNPGGEGPLSLARAFLAAGASDVVCTLWQIYDRPTAKLMENFYKALLKEKSTARALRQAQRKMAKDKQTANPRFWAGFVRVE